MKDQPPKLYQQEQKKDVISLTNEQKDKIRQITLGIEEVDETVRNLALEDVIATLQNGHQLNRLIEQDKDIKGYIACEDFVPNEAYIKYLGTTRDTGRNLLTEIPAFLEYAKSKGYTKLNFHGWNDRLNKILTRYGFERLRTDTMVGEGIDFYEKSLTESKSKEDLEQERQKAFEQKYINKINNEYEQTLKTFKEEILAEKKGLIDTTFQNLAKRLSDADTAFGERQKAILRLKLARYFQREKTIDTNVLFDAIVESPKFMTTDKGSLHRLFEIHIEKTMQKVAELRRRRAEAIGENDINPYEALFETDNGKYYMARLLNMPHLEDESLNMGTSCVGTSDHYYKEILNGNIEILSFRKTPEINKETNKLEGDTPLMTIEYNLKTKTIEQMKKYDDEYLQNNDPYYGDVIDALKQLRTTKTDTGEFRDFKKISDSELENFEVKEYHILTENGEVHFKDFNPNSDVFILKIGSMPVTTETPKDDAVKIIQIMEKIQITEDELAYNTNEINENTKVFIGPLEKGIFEKLPSLEYVYTSFPDNRIQLIKVPSDIEYPKTKDAWLKAYKEKDISLESGAEEMLEKMEQTTLPENQKFVRITVADLGFSDITTYQKICNKAEALGLELCAQDDGPKLRLSYDQPNSDYIRTAMKSIEVSDGGLRLWVLYRDDDGESKLRWDDGRASYGGDPGSEFVFRLRK